LHALRDRRADTAQIADRPAAHLRDWAMPAPAHREQVRFSARHRYHRDGRWWYYDKRVCTSGQSDAAVPALVVNGPPIAQFSEFADLHESHDGYRPLRQLSSGDSHTACPAPDGRFS